MASSFDALSLRKALQPYSAVVVTGGSSGIGKSFIELGGKLNADLPFCNLSRRAPAENSSGQRLNHFPCDLSRPGEIERAAAEIQRHLDTAAPKGPVLLINNSGFGAYGVFPAPNLAHQLEMIDVNVRAVVHLTGVMLPWLRTRGGVIVNIASTVAFQPTAYAATYGATKAFVLHWTLALNEELRGTALRALAVCPGPVNTPFTDRAGLKSGSMASRISMTGEEIAAATFRAVASRRAQVVPGWINKFYTFAGSKLSKPLAARIGAKVMASFRLRSAEK